MKYQLSDIPPFEISRGFTARFIHTESMTLAFVDIEAGADLAQHAHVHEQVVNLLEGEFELVVDGTPVRLVPGQSYAIPSNMPHSGRAITACRILDVFNPVREDFRKGEVAYKK
ncbi:MAG: cupin domain-containing protein [Bacteroidetes bacterium]|nr:cupin domain-containing protein [Bacteroidota bacterium]